LVRYSGKHKNTMSIVPISAAVPSGKKPYSPTGAISQAQIPQEIMKLEAQIQAERFSKDGYATQQAVIQSLQMQIQQLQQQTETNSDATNVAKQTAANLDQPTITPWSATPTTRFLSVKV
jgi:hypothetical protein